MGELDFMSRKTPFVEVPLDVQGKLVNSLGNSHMKRKQTTQGKSRGSRVSLPAQPNQSLMHGIECLEALLAAHRPMGNRELAELLGMEPTRINRLLGTLTYLGLLHRTASRKYTAGPGIHVLSAIALSGSPLLKCSLPDLRELQADSRVRCVALGVLWRTSVCYVYFGERGAPLEACIASRGLYPAEDSSIGRVLLAACDDADIANRYRHMSSTEIAKLQKVVQTVRDAGHSDAYDHSSLAVAIGEPKTVAGLAVVPSPDMEQGYEPLINMLHEHAANITERLRCMK